jgi:dipeptidyl aminopeptidase/acylaminoacyl peptidase
MVSRWARCSSWMVLLSCSSLAGAAEPAWSVRDSINTEYFSRGPDGWFRNGRQSPLTISPDGEWGFTVKTRGDLDCDCNIFLLEVFSLSRASEAIASGRSRLRPTLTIEVRSRLSWNFQAGLSNARWTRDSTGILFLAANGDSVPQVNLLRLADGNRSELTAVPGGVWEYSYDGGVLLFRGIVRDGMPDRRLSYPAMFIGEAEFRYIVGGSEGPPFHLFVKRGMEEVRDLGEIQPGRAISEFQISPNGRYAINIRQLGRGSIPSDWRRFGIGPEGPAFQYELYDLQQGTSRPLFDFPADSRFNNFIGSVLWTADSSRVLISSVHGGASLPDGGADVPGLWIADVEVRTGAARFFARAYDAFSTELRWNAVGSNVQIVRRWLDGRRDPYPASYRYENLAWHAASESVSSTPVSSPAGPTIFVDESANLPPTIYAITSRGRIEINSTNRGRLPALRQTERMTWSDGQNDWAGGITMPARRSRSDRSPLVVVAYKFEPDLFLPDGVSTTAFVVQALAAQGFVVLQMDCTQLTWPSAGRQFVEGLDAAISNLSTRGIIDPHRVGLITFSFSGQLARHALTHPGRQPLAAAVIADAADTSYFSYLTAGSGASSYSLRFFENANESQGRFWLNKDVWLRNAPGFNLEAVRSPVLISVNGRHNVINELEFVAGLRMLNRPVDFLLFPEGVHQLRRPRERLASMQASLDWMMFWLRGSRGTELSSRERSERWEQLQLSTCASERGSPPHCSPQMR